MVVCGRSWSERWWYGRGSAWHCRAWGRVVITCLVDTRASLRFSTSSSLSVSWTSRFLHTCLLIALSLLQHTLWGPTMALWGPILPLWVVVAPVCVLIEPVWVPVMQVLYTWWGWCTSVRSSLCHQPRLHCSTDKNYIWRPSLLCCRSDSMEQSAWVCQISQGSF